ncbi:MAG: hypothetical protein ABI614_18565 [Planctomycetota bacterium]
MKHYPVILLYILVPVIGLLGIQDSARHDRTDAALQRSVKTATEDGAMRLKATVRELQQDLEHQSHNFEARVAQLRRQLESSLAAADSLQQEVAALQTQLDDNSERLAADIERERDARELLSQKCDSAFGKQTDIVNIFQELADSSRARALAEQRVSELAALEAATLTRLAAQVTQDVTQLADADDADDLLVAVAVTHEAEPAAATATDTDTESEDVAGECCYESDAEVPVASEQPAPDA